MTTEEIIALTVKNEGAFTINPDDDGNWTGGKKGAGELKGSNFGISAKSYPSVDIKGLTLDQAVQIYKRDFWDKGNFGLLFDQAIAAKCFDTGVNVGLSLPIRWLQDVVGVPIDGLLGQQTANAVNAENQAYLLTQLRKRQALHYADIVVNDRSKLEFLKGWMVRVFA